MKILLWIIVIALIVWAGWAFLMDDQPDSVTINPTQTGSPSPTSSPTSTGLPTQTASPSPTATQTAPSSLVVRYTDSGFVSNAVTVRKGGTVTFRNESSKKMWPASARHPDHTVYPGSSIQKCGTANQSSIFDACKGYDNGQSWTFTFNEVGKWFYHDHLNPGSTGSITVQ